MEKTQTPLRTDTKTGAEAEWHPEHILDPLTDLKILFDIAMFQIASYQSMVVWAKRKIEHSKSPTAQLQSFKLLQPTHTTLQQVWKNAINAHNALVEINIEELYICGTLPSHRSLMLASVAILELLKYVSEHYSKITSTSGIPDIGDEFDQLLAETVQLQRSFESWMSVIGDVSNVLDGLDRSKHSLVKSETSESDVD